MSLRAEEKHMEDTQVDLTKRFEQPAPAAPMPDHDAPDSDERLASVERSLKRSRVVLGLLVAVMVVVVVAAVALTVGAYQRLDALANSFAALEQSVAAAPSAGGASSDGGNSAAADASTAVDDDATGPEEEVRAADLSDIINQKWSNALRMLEARGIDADDLVIVTSDGGSVIDPGNWTVTMVTDIDDTGGVAVHLRHDIDWF